MSTDFTVVIPARYASSRLPGKPLLDIAGKPMIAHVYQRALLSKAKQVIIATDDDRIVKVANSFGAKVCKTSNKHQSGTERIAEIIDKYDIADNHILVNVQGDEPLIPPSIIDQVANNLARTQASMATLAVEIDNAAEVFDSNSVKVVMDKAGFALYFSRASIPFDREQFSKPEPIILQPLKRHIGIYAYDAAFVKRYLAWPSSPLEQIESLEQLRVLYQGEKIHVDIAKQTPARGVDTQEDLDAIRAMF